MTMRNVQTGSCSTAAMRAGWASFWRLPLMASLFILLLAFQSAAQSDFTISPMNGTFTGVGGTITVNVSAPVGTAWSASSNAAWLNATGSGSGAGAVQLQAEANDTNAVRTAQVTIGPATFFAVQEPLFAVIQFLPEQISASATGGLRTITVLVQPANLKWQATSNTPWITVVTPPDVGSGNLGIAIATNNSTVSRTGTVSILGNNLTVMQAAGINATFSLSANAVSLPKEGGSGMVTVTVTPKTTAWTAISGAPWIAASPSQLTGDGAVSYTVEANPTNSARQGVIRLGSAVFTISQAANPDAGGGPTPGSTFSLSTGIVNFTVAEGSTTEVSQSLAIGSTGEPLNFSVEVSGAAWLRARSTTGTTPTNVLFTANPTGLTRGTLLGTIRIRSTSNSAVVELPARIRVSPPEGTPDAAPVSPRSLYFSRISGDALPANQTVMVGRPGEALTASLSIPPAATWLQAVAVAGAEGTTITASLRNLNFLPGLYETAITVSSPANQFQTFEIPVAYRVQLAPMGNPYISSGGIVNGASFEQGASVNTWLSIFGSGLAKTTRNWRTADFQGGLLPTRLDGVEVTIGGKKAAIAYVSPTQINLLPQAGVPLGGAEVVVSVDGALSEPAKVYLTPVLPAFFTFGPMSGKYAAALHLDSRPVGPATLFSSGPPARPAKPGEVIQIFGTGFGVTNPPVDPSRLFQGAATLVDKDLLKITIGGVPATVGFAGLSSTGLNQFNVTVPALAAGDHELVAEIDGVFTRTGVFVRVEP
ncbi:MAG: BACON domain-containing carbohydrate-binding protein [Bryobacterales bacterium]|nr:BACON domain-containing carbohydrate-binding protein [Bryobacterales bacterium]